MARETVCSGKTVEAALEAALTELNVSRDEVEYEVLEMPKEKFLGILGGSDAKIKVTVVEKEPEVEENKEGGRSRNRNRRRNNKKNDRQNDRPAVDGEESEDLQPLCVDKGEPLGTLAEDYLTKILTLMGIEGFTVTARKDSVTRNENTLFIYIEGPALGPVIGKKGETLDALQHLANLVNRKDDSTPSRVVVDAGDYRLKREAYLTKTAKSAISRAVRYSRNVSLEPMNAYERRFIHTIVQEAEGVSSKSVGEDPYRKVIISADDAPEYEEREDRRRRDGRDGRGGRGGRGGRSGRSGRSRNDRPVYEREAGQPIGRREDHVPHAKRDVSIRKTYSDAVFESKANDGEIFSLYEKIEPKFPSMEEVGFVAPVEKKDEE